ncbi:hypothetical protein NDU88_000422 [Pleurodeles waltl]|uniref:Uncharacterized protein n=1 Tax=Pleurodeles waltl TaxID=8319 RepID=A0AAV7P464_PLEWA|nr:hypothetical protein NDU88_000422 [Pleurodeles waltl]
MLRTLAAVVLTRIGSVGIVLRARFFIFLGVLLVLLLLSTTDGDIDHIKILLVEYGILGDGEPEFLLKILWITTAILEDWDVYQAWNFG